MTLKEVRDKAKLNDYDLTLLSHEELDILDRADKLYGHKGKLVRHFKGKIYQVIDFAKHTETKEELVIYKAMYGEYSVYARPIDMFISKVDKNKYPDAEQEYRMVFISIA